MPQRLFENIQEKLDNVPSVRLYQDLQQLKKLIINDIAEGNQVGDYDVLQDKQLKAIYQETALNYRFRLGIDNGFDEARIKEELEYFSSQQANRQDLTIRKSLINTPRKEMQSNNLIFECTIYWDDAETSRTVNVIRVNHKGEREIVPEVFERGYKAGSSQERSIRTNIPIGRPDVAFYNFFINEFLLNDSRVMKLLLELDLLLGREVQKLGELYQLSVNNPHTELAIEESPINVKAVKMQLRTLQETWLLLKKRHALLFDYFMALCFIEDHQALYNQIEEAEKKWLALPIKAAVKLEAENAEDNINWLFHLYRTEEGLLHQKELFIHYHAIRDNFYKEYITVRKKINEKTIKWRVL